MINVDVSKYINKLFSVDDFEYILCERKNGKKFIKVIKYFNDADGFIEVARINPIKNNFSEDGDGDLTHLYDVLHNLESITEGIKYQLRNKQIK